MQTRQLLLQPPDGVLPHSLTGLGWNLSIGMHMRVSSMAVYCIWKSAKGAGSQHAAAEKLVGGKANPAWRCCASIFLRLSCNTFNSALPSLIFWTSSASWSVACVVSAPAAMTHIGVRWHKLPVPLLCMPDEEDGLVWDGRLSVHGAINCAACEVHVRLARSPCRA